MRVHARRKDPLAGYEKGLKYVFWAVGRHHSSCKLYVYSGIYFLPYGSESVFTFRELDDPGSIDVHFSIEVASD